MVSMAEARSRFFAANHFAADGGDSEAWVDVTLGPVPMPFPNSDARRRAVRYHDLHHVLTGYQANTIGEFEISAWELAAGCGRFAAAWVINLGGLLVGLFASPRRVWAAFVRGRRSRTLYSLPFEPLLGRDLEEVRAEQGLSAATHQAGMGDVAVLVGAIALALAVWLPVIALSPVIIVPWFIGGRRFLREKRALKAAQASNQLPGGS